MAQVMPYQQVRVTGAPYFRHPLAIPSPSPRHPFAILNSLLSQHPLAKLNETPSRARTSDVFFERARNNATPANTRERLSLSLSLYSFFFIKSQFSPVCRCACRRYRRCPVWARSRPCRCRCTSSITTTIRPWTSTTRRASIISRTAAR
jgi:hypothetical protein